MDRRTFLRGSVAGTALASIPQEMLALTPSGSATADWDGGAVQYILPTVSDSEILIKLSLAKAASAAPILWVDNRRVPGTMTDTRGECWQFHAKGLAPGRRYTLSLQSGEKSSSRRLCPPWQLSTFPDPGDKPRQFRLLTFTCAGGHEAIGFLAPGVRQRLLRRGLSFQPHAVIANGDHVYWDLRSPLTAKSYGNRASAIAGHFDRASPIFGYENEFVLKRAAAPQIVPVYGNLFRSTPVFFIQDDHDYFDNDDALDDIVTFPPDQFMTSAARATQAMYYPEFLPDRNRPRGIPGASIGGRESPVSESFGTLRYGRLVEMLLYTVRRGMTMAGPSAVFLEDTVESWLHARTRALDTDHLVHVPSNPPGWSAGKWGEWYGDVLGQDGRLGTDTAKPYWQRGWLRQHDRLMQSMSAMQGRIAMSMSGDLHAIAAGRMLQTGNLDLSRNPVHSILTGPIGTRAGGWPSGVRKVGAQPSVHLRMEEFIKPIEQHGFTIADFTEDKVVLQFFKWNVNQQTVNDIDTLSPFETLTLSRN